MARIGLMGCGVVAGYGHLPAIAAVPELTLAAIFEPGEARRREIAALYPQAVPCATEAEFFAQGLDAVAVTSPAPCHHANVLAAARAGCHVLCEKPLATDPNEIIDMAAAMERAGKRLFTGFVYRYAQPAQEIRRLVRERAIGEVRALRLIYNWSCHQKWNTAPDGTRQLNARREGRMREGGPMVDCGTHQIDLARWWLGQEVIAEAGHGAWIDEQPYPDHVWLHLTHANGVHTMVEMSYAYTHTAAQPRYDQFRYELIGTEGVIRYDHDGKLFEVRNSTGTTTLPYDHEAKNFRGIYQDFARFLATGEVGDLGSVHDGSEAVRLARTVTERLAQEHRPLARGAAAT